MLPDCFREPVADPAAVKQSEVITDSVHFYEELRDALHFFVQLCTAGMGPEDLARIYHRKAAVNKFRQESRY
jgi:hypothetical protein